MSDDTIKTAKLGDIKPDVHNANAHTERGTYMLNQSVGKFGSREAGTVDKNGFIVGGNNRHTTYGALGIDDIQIIKADANKPVFLQYDDLDLTDPDNPARELSVALNRSAQVGISFDPEVLAEYQLAEVDLGDWFKEYELYNLGIGGDANDPNEEWQGMPEFEQEDNFGAIATLKVHFANIEDMEIFSNLIGQTVNEKTSFIWYPKQKNENLKAYKSTDES